MTEEISTDPQVSLGDHTMDFSLLLDNFSKNEPIFDNELLYPTPRESEITHFEKGNVVHATIESIITHLSSPEIIDYQFLVDFFLTFREFIESLPLLELILCRLSWSLKSASGSSQDSEKAKIGTLALVRTFVMLRHWLLNHFQDDFINNCQLRQLLVDALNEISKHKVFKSDLNSLQTKVIVDLKKTYIKLCHIYWSTTSLERLEKVDILNYDLSSYESMPNTRLSVLGLKQLRDPSARRSGILSMVEKRSSGATNLLLQEHETIKEENSLERILQSKTKARKINNNNTREKFILYPKASLMSLAPTHRNNVRNIQRNSTLDNLFINILEDVEATPIQGVTNISNLVQDDNSNKENGFSLNGKVNVFKESKTSKIAPGTPLKKMDAMIKVVPKPANTVQQQLQFEKLNKAKNKKKGFLKSLMFHNKDSKTSIVQSSTRKDQIPIKEPEIQSRQSNKTSNNNSKTNITEEVIITQGKIDLLSSRVINEYQHLIGGSASFKKRLSKQLLNNSSKQSVLSTGINLNGVNEVTEDYTVDSPTKSKSKRYDDDNSFNSTDLLNDFNNHNNNNMDFNNADNGTISDLERSFNENNDDEYMEQNTEDVLEAINRISAPSFKTPSVTMNWSNSLDVSNSDNVIEDIVENNGKQEVENEVQPITQDDVELISILSGAESFEDVAVVVNNDDADSRSDDKFEDSRNDLEPITNTEQVIQGQTRESDKISLMSSSSDLTEFEDDEFHSSFRGLENNDVVDLGNRFSVNIISRDSHISTRSYVTYDSEFSRESKKLNHNFSLSEEKKLKKKSSFVDLRVINSPQKVNIELDDIYNGAEEEEEERQHEEEEEEGQDSNNNDNDDEYDEYDNYPTEEHLMMMTLPFYNVLEEQEQSLPNPVTPRRTSISDSSKSGDSTVSMISSPDQSFLPPYPGISQTAIAELAAIPDERFGNDPINHTLCKLRGNGNEACHYETKTELNHEKSVSNENMNGNDEHNDGGSDRSIDEIKLEAKVRDLFISSNPNKANTVNQTKLIKTSSTSSKFDISSLSITPKKSLVITEKSTSVEEIMYKGNHIPFILSFSSIDLSEQLTLIERDSLLEIDWKELIDLNWETVLTPYNSWLKLLLEKQDKTGVNTITLRFNLMTNWIISEILLCKDLQIRLLTISRFIHIANNCKNLQNYSTLYQIMLALNSKIIKDLKKTWITLNIGDLLLFKKLKDLTSIDNNFKIFRNELNNIKISKGVIPFLALDLSDLTVNSERPTIITNSNKETRSIVSTTEENDDDEDYELINIDKFRNSCLILKKILRFIDWSKLYKFKANNEILSKCLYISSLSEEEMNYCSNNLIDP